MNRIRTSQPDRRTLTEYFPGRNWKPDDSLEACVARGMKIAKDTEKPFTWLTSTNRGAAEVCQAALRVLKLTPEELAGGFPCDCACASPLPIVVKKGILIRLTRNLDKDRGYVNGAVGVVRQALNYAGGAPTVVTVELSNGALVLAHHL